MNRITITIDVPEGAQVSVVRAAQEIFGDDLDDLGPVPTPSETRDHGAIDPTPFPKTPNADVCPVHRVAWKIVPAGVSKKTGKPYSAFTACPERDCQERPA